MLFQPRIHSLGGLKFTIWIIGTEQMFVNGFRAKTRGACQIYGMSLEEIVDAAGMIIGGLRRSCSCPKNKEASRNHASECNSNRTA